MYDDVHYAFPRKGPRGALSRRDVAWTTRRRSVRAGRAHVGSCGRASGRLASMLIGGASGCCDCGSSDVNMSFGGDPLCDPCADRRLAASTGLPLLPDPPAPIELPDGRGVRHRFRFRVWRAITGVEVELLEQGAENSDGGHRFAVLGSHDADVTALVDAVVARATATLAAGPRLEPKPHGSGWQVAGDVVEGRFEWGPGRADDDPCDVVIDGRRLTWDEFGRTLGSFEGWRFRLVIEDRCDDLRPDADIIPLPVSHRQEQPPMTLPTISPTISALLEEFQLEQQRRLAPRTFRNYADIIGLLRDCLNGYGHQALAPDQRDRWEAAVDDDPDAFVHLFGAEELVANLGEFLNYFMIRKVMASEDLLRSAGTVTRKLVGWLGERQLIDTATAAAAAERAADAARDLPKADRLARILHDHAAHTDIEVDDVSDDDYLEDYLMVERMEPGQLWFEGGVGPVAVPTAATDLAQPGWSINVVLARTGATWHLLDVGNVYP